MTPEMEEAEYRRYQEINRGNPDVKSWIDLTAEEKAEFSKNSEEMARSATAKRLLSFIERIERLEEEKKGIMDDIKEVKAECKSDGFDIKTVTAILKRRKMDAADLAEADALLETYEAAIEG